MTEGFYSLQVKVIWRQFLKEHFSFWMICGYLFIEYVRPQSIIPALDILPWGFLFLVLATLGWFLDSSAKWVSNPANKWMLIYFLLIVISSFAAEYPDISRSHYKDFYSWVLIYFAVINIVTTPERFFIFLMIFLVSSFKISSFAARVWAAHGFSFSGLILQGPPGYFENSGELTIQMLMFAPIAYQLSLILKPHLGRFKYGVFSLFPVTGVMTILGASSRGGQLGLVLQVYHIFLKRKISFKKILLVLAGAIAAFYLMPEDAKQRFAHAGEDKTSQQRLLYWKHGLEMIQEHPLLGVGYFNFAPYYETHFRGDMLYARAELPHNIFIQVATDCGILGLLVYLGLIYHSFAAQSFIKKQSVNLQDGSYYYAIANGLSVACWGFLVAGQFVTVTYYPFFWINLAFTNALKNIVQQRLVEETRSPRAKV